MKARLVFVLSAALLLAGSSAALSAEGFPEKCAGTYLMAEDGGATSLWTFGADGTFFASSSLQALLNFSDQQGSWERDGFQILEKYGVEYCDRSVSISEAARRAVEKIGS